MVQGEGSGKLYRSETKMSGSVLHRPILGIHPQIFPAVQRRMLFCKAKTDPANAASFAVLVKNGFQKTAEQEGFLHWIYRF